MIEDHEAKMFLDIESGELDTVSAFLHDGFDMGAKDQLLSSVVRRAIQCYELLYKRYSEDALRQAIISQDDETLMLIFWQSHEIIGLGIGLKDNGLFVIPSTEYVEKYRAMVIAEARKRYEIAQIEIPSDILNSISPSEKAAVYVIQESGEMLYKIGRSSNYEKRLGQLRTATPHEINVIFVINTSDSKRLEKYLHKQFEPKRRSGEWFNLDHGDLMLIERLHQNCLEENQPGAKQLHMFDELLS